VSVRGEARLLRLVNENRGKVLKDITIEFKVRNGILHTNNLYRLVVRKRMEEVNRKIRLALCM